MKDRLAVRTLVIDDDESVCRKLQTWLVNESYDVASYTRAAEGISFAQRVPCEVALIDLRMPDSDGVDVLTAVLRASPQTRIVAMAAFPEVDLVVQAVRAGARDLLSKPIQQAAVLEAIERQIHDMGLAARTEDGFNRRLGLRLRELRTAAQRTQQDVAQAADITAAQLSQIELGKTATSTWTLARICGAMKVSLSALFGEL